MEVARLDIVIRSEQAVRATKKVGSALNKVADTAATSTKRMEGSFSRLKTSIFSMRTAVVGLGAAFVFRSAINTIREFEKSMSATRAVIGATGKEFDALSQSARNLGAVTTFTASEAADAMFELGQAGLDTTAILGAVGPTLGLAQAGMLGMAESANITAKVLNNFGIAASDAGRVTDILTQAANAAATGVRSTGVALKFIGPIAANVGTTLEDTTALIGALSNAGLDASLAGTGLRQTFLALAAPGSVAIDILDKLNIALSDIDPTTNNAIDIIERFADVNIQAGDASRIFGARAANAVLALSKNVPLIRSLREEIGNSAGATEEFARILTDNLDGAIKRMNSAFQEMTLQTGDSGLGGALRGLVDFTTSLINAFNGLLPSTIEANEKFFALKDTIKLLGVTLGGLLLGKTIAGLITFGTATVAATASLKGMTLAQLSLNGAMLANPVVLITTLLFTAAGALLIFGDRTRSAKQALTDLNDVLDKSKKAFNTYVSAVREANEELEKTSRITLSAALVGLNKELRISQGELRNVTSEINKLGKDFDLVFDVLRVGLANPVDPALIKNIQGLFKEFEAGNIGVDETIAKLKEFSESGLDGAEKAGILAEKVFELRDRYLQADESIGKLNERIREGEDALRGIIPALEDAADAGEDFGQMSKKINAALDALEAFEEKARKAALGKEGLAREIIEKERDALIRQLEAAGGSLEAIQRARAAAIIALQAVEQTGAGKTRAELVGEELEGLQDTYDRVGAAAREYADIQTLVADAERLGIGTAEERALVLERSRVVLQGVKEPLQEMNDALDQQIGLLSLTSAEREIQNQLLAAELSLRAQGVELSKAERSELEEKLRMLQTQDNDLVIFLEQAKRNAQDILGEGIAGIITGDIDDVPAKFARMLVQLYAQYLASQIFKSLFSGSGQSLGGGLLGTIVGGIGKFFGGGAIPLPGSVGESGAFVGPPAPGVSGARGADFIVPPGFLQDSFRVNVSSGERVQVTPEGERGNGGDINVTINAPGADAGTVERIKEIVRVELAPQIIQAASDTTVSRLKRPSFA